MADTYPKNTIDDNGLKKVWDMVMDRLGLKVDKEAGKGLSTNDYDNTAKNKVDNLGSASTKNVATTGDASSSQVVMGNDSRLSDSRTPKSHTHTKNDITDFAHTHPLSIATDTGTSAITLAHGGKYKLTAGGSTLVFTMPSDNDHYSWSDITDKPSSYPPSAHTHTVSQITDFPSTMPPSSHTHGNIQNGGTLQTNDVAIANGDKLVITDSSDSSKIARASIAFDGSTATKCLTQKGTWENFTNNAGTVTSVKVGSTSYSPSSGVVSLPAYPTTLPASDVYAWAKAATKPTYTPSEIGAKPIKSQISRATITNGYYVKLFSANYNGYNFLGIDMIAYRGYADSIRAKLFMRFIPAGFTPDNSRVLIYGFSADTTDPSNVIRITKDNDTTFSVWVQVNGTNSRYGYDILAVSDESNAFFNGTDFVAARWSFPTTFETSSTAPTNVVANKSYLTSVSWSDIGSKPTSFTPSSHTHGNIQNGGTLQATDITIANGDKLVVTDSSDSSKIARASISFDGSTATKCLTQKGTWETFASSNTDTKVTQTNTTTNTGYEVLLSESPVSSSGTLTEGARKSKYLYYNPGAVALYLKNPADTTSFWFSSNSGTGTSSVRAEFTIGNSTASGTKGNRYGVLTLFSKQSYYAEILTSDTFTASRSFYLPNKNGTIALTSDIPAWGSAVTLWSDWANGKNTTGTITLSYSWGNYRLICFVYGSANNVKVMSVPGNVLNAVFTNRPTYGLILEDWNGGWMDIVSTNSTNQLNIPRVSGGTATTFSLFAIYGL